MLAAGVVAVSAGVGAGVGGMLASMALHRVMGAVAGDGYVDSAEPDPGARTQIPDFELDEVPVDLGADSGGRGEE